MSVVKGRKIVLGYPCQVCDKAAFYLRERPFMEGTVISTDLVFNREDKKQPENGEWVSCQYCRAHQCLPLLIKEITIFHYDTGEFA